MSDDIKKNISDVNIWKRALFMLLFAIFYGLCELVIWAVVLFQFLIVLITGAKNERLLEFGQNLTTYIYQIVLFQTFNTERQPFPFGDWPDGPPEDDEEYEDDEDDKDEDDEDDKDEDDEDDKDEDDEEPASSAEVADDDAAESPAVEAIQLESDDIGSGDETEIADDDADEEVDPEEDSEDKDKPAS